MKYMSNENMQKKITELKENERALRIERLKLEKLEKQTKFKHTLVNEKISWVTKPKTTRGSVLVDGETRQGTYLRLTPDGHHTNECNIKPLSSSKHISILIPETWVEYDGLIKVTIEPIEMEVLTVDTEENKIEEVRR